MNYKLAKYALSTYLKKYVKPGAIKPAFCDIKVTERCNFRCIMCASWKLGDKRTELTTDKWIEIIDEIRRLGYLNLRFTGGEPLLREDLPLLIEEARKQKLAVSISTNGFLIDEPLAGAFSDLKVSKVAVSLHGIGSKHDRITGCQRAFQRVSRSLDYLLANNVPCTIAITIMEETIEDIPSILRFAEEKGIPCCFNLLNIEPYFFRIADGIKERWINNQDKTGDLAQLLKKEKKSNPKLVLPPFSALGFIPKYFTDPVQKNIPCMASVISTCINANGDVYGGCWVLNPVGNVANQGLEEILTSSAYATRAENTFRKRCPGCACGYVENLLFIPKNLLHDALQDIGFFINLRRRLEQ